MITYRYYVLQFVYLFRLNGCQAVFTDFLGSINNNLPSASQYRLCLYQELLALDRLSLQVFFKATLYMYLPTEI